MERFESLDLRVVPDADPAELVSNPERLLDHDARRVRASIARRPSSRNDRSQPVRDTRLAAGARVVFNVPSLSAWIVSIHSRMPTVRSATPSVCASVLESCRLARWNVSASARTPPGAPICESSDGRLDLVRTVLDGERGPLAPRAQRVHDAVQEVL